jgi:hypothetical protein
MLKAPNTIEIMALTCNIDARGKAARLIYGVLMLGIGALMVWLWAWRSGGAISWFCSICVMLAGLFAVFEARAGWCVLRAMGVRTPM